VEVAEEEVAVVETLGLGHTLSYTYCLGGRSPHESSYPVSYSPFLKIQQLPDSYGELVSPSGLKTAYSQASDSAHRLRQLDAPELAAHVSKQSSGAGYPHTLATADGDAVAAQAPDVVVAVEESLQEGLSYTSRYGLSHPSVVPLPGSYFSPGYTQHVPVPRYGFPGRKMTKSQGWFSLQYSQQWDLPLLATARKGSGYSQSLVTSEAVQLGSSDVVVVVDAVSVVVGDAVVVSARAAGAYRSASRGAQDVRSVAFMVASVVVTNVGEELKEKNE
jgi:hypothetical protein